MKVREIEMILSEMGAICTDNPQESLGENEKPTIRNVTWSISDYNSHKKPNVDVY